MVENIDIPYYWYALYTKSRAEKKVYDELMQRGIETYLPLRKELKHWSDRKKWIESPIIHSYVFVHIPDSDYLRVFEAKGVMAYVSIKRKAVVIPDHEIEAMKRAVNSKLSLNVEPSNIQKGQIVTISSGPLKGITGEVVEVQGTKKFYLRISNIGYTLVVTLDDDKADKNGKEEKTDKTEKNDDKK